MESAVIAKRAAIIVHPELVGFYGDLGFADEGDSKVTFAGGGWKDMVRVFPDPKEEEEEIKRKREEQERIDYPDVLTPSERLARDLEDAEWTLMKPSLI